MWRHPKYYKELRKRNKETQQELQRILDKPGRSVSNSDQTISLTLADGCNGSVHLVRASSFKQQASSTKRQAFEPTCSSIKQQASSPEAQASSAKPQAASSEIREPRNMDIGEVLGEQGPRVFAKINVLCG